MFLELWRIMSGLESTIGVLYATDTRRQALCFTLEDQFQKVKVKAETRIPAGTYKVTLRTDGPMHERYAQRFGPLHKGMLWIRDVPGFEYVYLHCGNTDQQTEGCPLLGDVATESVHQRGSLANSETAYRRVYPQVAAHLLAGHEVRLQITDVDQPPGIP